jgi:N6-L-threonylcarbamoyladenine synthase
VVPEIASRRHLETMVPVIREALSFGGIRLEEADGIAVTNRPGLIGALLVGLSAAKGLALAAKKPLIPVHHIHAHIYAALMGHQEIEWPVAALVVSGGHTSLYRLDSVLKWERIGATQDDAAGEAFDKVASILGLGYPGGPAVEKAALGKKKGPIAFPRSYPGEGKLNFSFSGLKTAVLYHCKGVPGKKGSVEYDAEDEGQVSDVAASFQAAVVDVLVKRTFQAAKKSNARAVAVGGGVAANRLLRERMEEEAVKEGMDLYMTPTPLATDNAVMVAGLGYHLVTAGVEGGLDLDAYPR